jgi:Histidinol-phosphate/aromatic aminotransferase and cobyric acid decarboxylase
MDIDNSHYRFKLDFNERSDQTPAWLSQAKINTDNLWRYPNRAQLEHTLSTDLGIPNNALLLTNGGDEGIDLLFKTAPLTKSNYLSLNPVSANTVTMLTSGVMIAALLQSTRHNLWR